MLCSLNMNPSRPQRHIVHRRQEQSKGSVLRIALPAKDPQLHRATARTYQRRSVAVAAQAMHQAHRCRSLVLLVACCSCPAIVSGRHELPTQKNVARTKHSRKTHTNEPEPIDGVDVEIHDSLYICARVLRPTVEGKRFELSAEVACTVCLRNAQAIAHVLIAAPKTQCF